MNTTSPRRSLLVTATAAAIVLGSAFAVAAPANAAERELADIENSLVQIETTYSGYVYYKYDGEWQWSDEITVSAGCTGWFASADGHIATAGHCVQPEQGRQMILGRLVDALPGDQDWENVLMNWTVEGYEEGSEIARTVQVVQPDGAVDPVIDDWTTAQVLDFQDFEDGDAALLKVAGVSGVQPLTVAAASPEVGDEVVSIGFPATVGGVVDDERLGASYKTGTVSSLQVTDGGVPVTEINAQVSGGMSGGPTIDAAGDVVGINSFGIYGETQSFNFVTDTEALAQFLTSHGVEFEAAAAGSRGDAETVGDAEGVPAAKTAPASDGGPLLGLLIGGLIAFLIAGGIGAAVFIVASRRRSRGTGAQGLPVQAPAPAPVAPAAYAAPEAYAPVAPQPVYAGAAEPQPVHPPVAEPQPVYASAPQPMYAAPAPVGFAAPVQAAPALMTAPPRPPLPPQQG